MLDPQWVVRFVVGGAIIAVLPAIARYFSATIAGILIVFPVVALVGLFFVERAVGVQGAVQAASGAVWGLPTVLAFLLTVRFLGPRVGNFGLVLLAALTAWLIVALLLYLLQRSLGLSGH